MPNDKAHPASAGIEQKITNDADALDRLEQIVMRYQDKHGKEITPGCLLRNHHDAVGIYEVIKGDDGRLYLGDFDSPLERYAPDKWWEIVSA